MHGFFSMDNSLFRFGIRLADLMLLNLLTLLCCIPVITIGPALSALHYIALRMVRDEDSSITRDFFHAFKRDLKQGIPVGLLYTAVIALLVYAALIAVPSGKISGKALTVAVYIICILVSISSSWVFVLLSRYTNTITKTILGSFAFGVNYLPTTVLMMILAALPIAILFFAPSTIPLVIMFGLSAPAFFQAKLYTQKLDHFEGKKEEVPDEPDTSEEISE